MSDKPDVTNAVQPGGPARSTEAGDVPDALRRRYLTEAGRNGAGIAYYTDATIVIPSFRDRGRQLIATRSDPNTIRDLVSIAQHRGWSAVQVSGSTGFRREAWLAGRTAGLEVDGYRPGERDLQILQRRLDAQSRRIVEREASAPADADRSRRPTVMPGRAERRRIVEAVVRDRVADPAIQARILVSAQARLATLLDREGTRDPQRRTAERNRNR
ncbi:LPD7 domain-containing protein [Phenylobacterium sp.]|uniref:LPD7 domain-containing protein n=1 Tax=Phenylobacterium sp. TaxID=1871053 RepID=UPI0035614967